MNSKRISLESLKINKRTSLTLILLAISAAVVTTAIPHPVFSQLWNNFEDTSYTAVNVFGGDLTLEVPDNWYVEEGEDGSINFCNSEPCESADKAFLVQLVHPEPGTFYSSSEDPGRVFDGLLQSEQANGLMMNVQLVTESDKSQQIIFNFKDPKSGIYYNGFGYREINNNRLFIAYFLATPDTWDSYQPIKKHITSTWHFNFLVDGGPAADKAFEVGQEILKGQICSQRTMVDNLDVNKGDRGFMTFDPMCQTYR